jgi:hypothetical protein
MLDRVGRSACFEGCLLDETVDPSLTVLIDSFIGRDFSLMERGGRWITEPFNKRYIMTPYKNNAPYSQADIVRWMHLSIDWKSSIVILQRFIQRSITSPVHRFTTSFENPSFFQRGLKQRSHQDNNPMYLYDI